MTLAVQDALDWTPMTPAGAGVAAPSPGARGGAVAAAPPAPRPSDPTPVVLAAVHNDPLPSRQTDRAHIEAAVVRCAAAHRGEVHISWLRKYVDRDVMPEMWGAVVHARRGFLEPAGYHLPSMGGSGNARKLSPVWRYVGPTHPTR